MKLILRCVLLVVMCCSNAMSIDQTIAERRGSLYENTSLAALPAYCAAEHNAGDMAMTVTNSGVFGRNYTHNISVDCFTGLPLQACEFPKGSSTTYLFSSSLWIGGIVGLDTLVSVGTDGWIGGAELNPDIAPLGTMKYRSILSTGPAREGAVSHQDFVATYWDTCTVGCPGLQNDVMDGRPHRPLGVRVDQKTYVWSDATVQSVVFFDLRITNTGTAVINKGYVGMYVDADVNALNDPGGYEDDVTGFINSVTDVNTACTFTRSIPVAWIADNDGELIESPRVEHVTATALLNAPEQNSVVSYNWWVSNGSAPLDFGPTRRANTRNFGTGGTGTPTGDRNKYWMLSNGDTDYDQVFTASILPTDSIWQYPISGLASDLTDGFDTRYLISVGPIDLLPGQSVPLVFAYVGGKNFHTDPTNIGNLPNNPVTYTSRLGFADLKQNVLWASWVYDNPGVDTDSDGYAGQFVVCGADTTWIAGDGIPDFKAAAPPTRPEMSATPQSGAVRVHWNGARSESSRDFFTSALDFEGYNVYLKQSGNAAKWQTVAGYDIEDYFTATYDFLHRQWTARPTPATGDALRCRYAPNGCDDLLWSPTNYSRSRPYMLPGFPDSISYWVPVGCNAHRFGYETPILKTYPNAPKPRWLKISDVPTDSLSIYVTTDGTFKFYEYELTIANLTPADSYFVSVTALDFGRASLTSFTPLETPIGDGAVVVVPLSRASCCDGFTGNIDCDLNESIDIADLSALIDHMFIGFTPLCCGGEANIDRDPDGTVDISDLSRLIDFLYISFAPLTACE